MGLRAHEPFLVVMHRQVGAEVDCSFLFGLVVNGLELLGLVEDSLLERVLNMRSLVNFVKL